MALGSLNLQGRGNTRLLGLLALLTMLGVGTMAGCYLTRPDDQAQASDVNNRNFTFASGTVFHTALANVSTALAFTDEARNFTLCSGSSTATGTNKFGSCTLTVTSTTYSAGAGPQVNEVITLDPCDFDDSDDSLKVSRGQTTITSATATAVTGSGCNTTNQITASNVTGQSFTFTDGGVFASALNNVSTALAFTNNAQQFTLTSAGVVTGTASGTSSVGGSTCRLTLTSSTYVTEPRANTTITLTPCTFNSVNKTLTATNAGLTVTSAAGQIVQ